jgi:hypothetical protein
MSSVCLPRHPAVAYLFLVRAMSLQDWSNLAQVIGALAVVISLFYVGFQVKKNTSAVRSATAQAVHNNYADWYMNISNDAELNRIAIKGLKDYASLGEIEKARFIETFMAFLSYSQNAFHQWREKSLSPPLWGGWELLVMNLLSSPGGKEFWKERGYVFGNEYRHYVQKIIMTKKPHPEARPLGAFKIGKQELG